MTPTRLWMAASALAIAQGPQGDLRVDLAKCAGIKGSAERLECYDAITRSLPTAQSRAPGSATAGATGGAGKWLVRTTKNPVDDSQTVVLALAEERHKATLIVRCKQAEAEVYINWQDYLGTDGTPVLTRLGDAKAETKRWSISTDHKATFYPSDDVAFIRQLLAVEKLVAQVTPYSESPVLAVFDVRGLDSAIIQLRATCKL